MRNEVLCLRRVHCWLCAEYAYLLRIFNFRKYSQNLYSFFDRKVQRLYIDNYYNSLSMTKALISSEIYVCGTLRDRRRGPDKLTTQKKALLKGTKLFFPNLRSKF
ncbi:hypothetical protein CDIK_2548 [Cucumispora dikerogammari]|nr:hypothetical protein CDIK_2548 [Cucumispora dikerogammari]